MPSILIAGTIVAKPKVELFPVSGRPRCEVRIRVEGEDTTAVYRVIGFEELMDELAALLPGDSVAVQGQLQVLKSYFARRDKQKPAPRMKVKADAKGVVNVEFHHPDRSIGQWLLMDAIGTADSEFMDGLLKQLVIAGSRNERERC